MPSISLGWNCYTASHAVDIGLRHRKAAGYMTCPFDEMLSNYDGVVKCLREDFRYFVDPEYLEIVDIPADSPYCAGDRLIRNRRYNFLFNHESPGHANLYLTQKWDGGINHYIDNNWEKFRERYSRRIQAFRDYVRTGDVHFLITKPPSDLSDLERVLGDICPTYRLTRFDVQNPRHYEDHMQLMDMTRRNSK